MTGLVIVVCLFGASYPLYTHSQRSFLELPDKDSNYHQARRTSKMILF